MTNAYTGLRTVPSVTVASTVRTGLRTSFCNDAQWQTYSSLVAYATIKARIGHSLLLKMMRYCTCCAALCT
jgi:hypothetical protein